MTEKEYEDIESIQIEITTCSKWFASTDNPVELYIGEHEWILDVENIDDFERGNTDTFDLEVPEDMDSSWFHYLCFRKRKYLGKDDNWCIKKIKLTVNGKVVYEKDNLNAWLQENNLSWCAPDFKYGQAGE
ncbi:MAG: PLAT/LH2 domain-containing protein [Asgard group archaeon]|nr:PLAT/LH2 domain-containing protein [Asgard group archaeon]